MDLTAQPGYVAGFPRLMNLRDLGGLVSADGRHVRHGMLYRSGPLVGLDAQQRAGIDALGLRHILDLRAAGEVAGAEDCVPAGCAYERVGGMRDEDGSEIDFSPASIARMRERLGQPDGMDSFMAGLYVSMAFGNAATHRLMALLVSGELPLLFHCSAGKDRTGVCAALILMALAVPDDAIRADFLLTNEYRREIIEAAPDEHALRAMGLDAKSWARANGVSGADLDGVFAAIDARHPTREAYFEAEYGLAGSDLARLRDQLLE